MHLYLANTKVDIIILLNYFRFFILHNLLLQKLRSIKVYDTAFIKKQASNYKLVIF